MKLLPGILSEPQILMFGQVTFLYHVSHPPKVLKRVFLTYIFLSHAGYSERVTLVPNSR